MTVFPLQHQAGIIFIVTLAVDRTDQHRAHCHYIA